MNHQENVKKVIPMFLLVFVLNASMIGAFNMIAPTLASKLGVSSVTVSLMPMIAALGLGIAGVVYAALSDYISMRKLMVGGIIMMVTGAVLSFFFANVNFYLLLGSIALLSLGGSCAASLLIIMVTKYLPANECPKFYGYSSACVGGGQALGFLIGGVMTTYLDWRFVFVVPMISIIALGSMARYVPDETSGNGKKLDVFGLILLTSFALLISLYFNISDVRCIIIAAVIFVVFFIYISKGKNTLITIDFFKNKSFIIVNVMAILVFGIQMSFNFLVSFSAQSIYQISPSKLGLLLLPNYIVVSIVGSNVGRIVKKFGSFKAMFTAMGIIIFCLLAGALVIDKNIFFLTSTALVIAGLYALPYTPFMQVVVSTLKPEQIGTGVGFFTLLKSVGQSVMIVITGKLIAMPIMHTNLHLVSEKATVFSNVMLVFAIVLLCVVTILSVQIKKGIVKINDK